MQAISEREAGNWDKACHIWQKKKKSQKKGGQLHEILPRGQQRPPALVPIN